MLMYRYLAIFCPNDTTDDSFSDYFYQQIMVHLEDTCCGLNTVLNVFFLYN